MIGIGGTIVCCGNTVQDILVRPVDEISYDRTKWVEQIALSVGGNGANTAYAAAILGAPVRLLTWVGEDDFASQITAKLGSAGVDLNFIHREQAGSTATTIALVRSDGARAFLHSPGVNRVAFAQGVDLSGMVVNGCSHFHLANPFSLVEMRSKAAGTLAKAKENGLTVSMDTGWDSRGEWIGVVGPCLEHVDLLFANEDEARRLSAAPSLSETASFFLDRGVGSLVIKLGGRGCAIWDNGTALQFPAFEIHPIDTTGAGDSFAGGFLAALSHGMSLGDAARLANAAGALSTMSLGSISGLLPLAETLAFAASTKVRMQKSEEGLLATE